MSGANKEPWHLPDNHNLVILVTKQAFDKALPRKINKRFSGLTPEQWEHVRGDMEHRLDLALDDIWETINNAIWDGTYFPEEGDNA